MADLRLLTLSLLLAASGCAFGPIWAPALEGTIRSTETGEPIPGVILVSYYHIRNDSLGGRCTRTDADGHFMVPGHLAAYPHWITGRSVEGPNLLAFHREFAGGAWSDSDAYRRTGEWLDSRDLRLRMEQPTYPGWRDRPRDRWWKTVCFDLAETAGDVRDDYGMHASCESIFEEECPGIPR